MKYNKFFQRNLPHIQPEDAVLFITYRLHFSLPEEYYAKVKILKSEFRKKIKKLSKEQIKLEKDQFAIELFDFKDNFYGKFKNSPFWFQDKRICKIVEDSLFWGTEKRYYLFAFCIMPNHVHILIRPNYVDNHPFSLQKIMFDHKHFTAIEANKILRRKGNFWQAEYFDRYIRNTKEFENVFNYIYYNPVKANLVNEPEEWSHTYVNDEIF